MMEPLASGLAVLAIIFGPVAVDELARLNRARRARNRYRRHRRL